MTEIKHDINQFLSYREAIRPILDRRGLDIDDMNVFVDQSNTPLPLNCETFLLGGTTMNIRREYIDFFRGVICISV